MKYGKVIHPKTIHSPIGLLPVRDGLTVSHPAFGPNHFFYNEQEVNTSYSHPMTGEQINFREPLTQESLEITSYFSIKDTLDLGSIVIANQGIFTNTNITDESKLKQLLKSAKKVNEIYFIDEKIAFAPYRTFKLGRQSSEQFARGGLARVLEHTSEKSAKILRGLALKEKVHVYVNMNHRRPHVARVVLHYDDSGPAFFKGLHVSSGYTSDSISYIFGVLSEKIN